MHSPNSPTQHTYFPEIQGLRAIAILLVLIYHIWPSVFTGGYVGVDVFFVISGYLITRSILTQANRSGSVSLLHFYKKRILRLLPAALVVLTIVSVTTPLLTPVLTNDVLQESIASIFYIQNWLLAEKATDYLQMHESASPLTHFWSLAIEEQFYIFWPIAILLAYKFFPGVHPPKRTRWLILTSTTILVTSLFYSTLFTIKSPEYAFFSTLTRAWELSIGTILALTSLQNKILTRLKPALGTLGISAILFSAFSFGHNTIFPGYSALLPTIGTALVIVSGSHSGLFYEQTLLRSNAAQFLGNISYSLYLWHWPILVFYTTRYEKNIAFGTGLILIFLAIIIAALSTYLLENPLRKNKHLNNHPKAVILGSTGLMLLLCGAILIYGNFNSSGSSASSQPSLKEQLLTIRQDKPDAYNKGCHLSIKAIDPVVCQYGNINSPVKMLIIGDSHAAQWIPAFEKIAIKNEWQLLSTTKSGCPYGDLPHTRNGKPYKECTEWNNNIKKLIKDLSPNIFILSQTNRYRPIPGGKKENYRLYAQAAEKILQDQSHAGARVVAIADTPLMNENVPECLSRHIDEPEKCSTKRELIQNIGELPDPLTTAAEKIHRAIAIDPLELVCNEHSCPAISKGRIIWRDESHLTASFARILAKDLEKLLKEHEIQ